MIRAAAGSAKTFSASILAIERQWRPISPATPMMRGRAMCITAIQFAEFDQEVGTWFIL
jgi:hypothetical protein